MLLGLKRTAERQSEDEGKYDPAFGSCGPPSLRNRCTHASPVRKLLAPPSRFVTAKFCSTRSSITAPLDLLHTDSLRLPVVMDAPIASAVVLPEDPLPPASPVPKRRQSSLSEQSAKRARLDNYDAPSGRRDSTTETKPDVPKRREKGRERRLFGAVLGALSQNPSTTAAQKRRSDIERRQLAQRRHEDEEGEQRKAERATARKIQRWKEQRSFERDSVCLLTKQHRTTVANVLSRCDFGTTTSCIRLTSSRPTQFHTW